MKKIFIPSMLIAVPATYRQKEMRLEDKMFHTEKSILSEHYGFTDALLEDTCVCKWQMVCLCNDCECNFCYSERRLKEVKNGQ